MKKQKGFVLVMAMIFLMILTILGVTVLRNTALEEKMAGNFSDLNVALQASESALAACESLVAGWAVAPVPFDTTNVVDGFHLPSLTAPWIYDPDSTVWESTDVIVYDTLSVPLDLPDQPMCIIEHLGTVNTTIPPAVPVMKDNFRISAKGYGWNNSVHFSQLVMEK